MRYIETAESVKILQTAGSIIKNFQPKPESYKFLDDLTAKECGLFLSHLYIPEYEENKDIVKFEKKRFKKEGIKFLNNRAKAFCEALSEANKKSDVTVESLIKLHANKKEEMFPNNIQFGIETPKDIAPKKAEEVLNDYTKQFYNVKFKAKHGVLLTFPNKEYIQAIREELKQYKQYLLANLKQLEDSNENHLLEEALKQQLNEIKTLYDQNYTKLLELHKKYFIDEKTVNPKFTFEEVSKMKEEVTKIFKIIGALNEKSDYIKRQIEKLNTAEDIDFFLNIDFEKKSLLRDPKKIADDLELLIKKYNEEIKNCKTDKERLDKILMCGATMKYLHLFSDCNTRFIKTFVQSEFMKYNLDASFINDDLEAYPILKEIEGTESALNRVYYSGIDKLEEFKTECKNNKAKTSEEYQESKNPSISLNKSVSNAKPNTPLEEESRVLTIESWPPVESNWKLTPNFKTANKEEPSKKQDAKTKTEAKILYR